MQRGSSISQIISDKLIFYFFHGVKLFATQIELFIFTVQMRYTRFYKNQWIFFDAGLNVLDLLVTPVGYYIIRDKRLTLKGLRGVSKNVSFRARVKHWFLMTFNTIINDIFPENFIEIP